MPAGITTARVIPFDARHGDHRRLAVERVDDVECGAQLLVGRRLVVGARRRRRGISTIPICVADSIQPGVTILPGGVDHARAGRHLHVGADRRDLSGLESRPSRARSPGPDTGNTRPLVMAIVSPAATGAVQLRLRRARGCGRRPRGRAPLGDDCNADAEREQDGDSDRHRPPPVGTSPVTKSRRGCLAGSLRSYISAPSMNTCSARL